MVSAFTDALLAEMKMLLRHPDMQPTHAQRALHSRLKGGGNSYLTVAFSPSDETIKGIIAWCQKDGSKNIMLNLALGMVEGGRFADDLMAGLQARVGRRPSGGSVVLEPTPKSRPIWDKRGFKQKSPESKCLAKEIHGSGVGDANVWTQRR